mgnify:CR=1 FL=1
MRIFVRNGGGLYVWHAGNNAFPHWPAYNDMIGLGPIEALLNELGCDNVAVVGATVQVGAELHGSLVKRSFPLRSLKLLASERSAGRKLRFGEQEIEVEALTPAALSPWRSDCRPCGCRASGRRFATRSAIAS